MDWAATLGYAETHTPQGVIAVRLFLAAVFGGIVGFEREANNQTAGLRTHILVSVAACLFTLLTFEIYRIALDGGSTNPDPVRAVEATTAGIAFLGAGAIFQQRGSVRGLTTGAGMWLAGAVGVATALGYYLIALGVSGLAVVVLAALRHFAHETVGGTEPEPGEDADRPERKRRGQWTGKSGHT